MKWQKNSIFKNYVLREFLGEGGFSEVWKAFDTDREKEVVVKILHDDQAMDQLKMEEALSKKLSPHLVPTVEEVYLENTPPFLVREYIPGKTLKEILKNQKLSWNDKKELALDLLERLIELHKANIVHGDLKPENIMICSPVSRRGILFLDIGGCPENFKEGLELSRDLTEEELRHQGTFLYMAPELREKGKKPDVSSDIYSMGLILFEIFAGRLPNGLELPSDVNPLLSKEFDLIIKKALAPRGKRYQKVEELYEDLENSTLLKSLSKEKDTEVNTLGRIFFFGLWILTGIMFLNLIIGKPRNIGEFYACLVSGAFFGYFTILYFLGIGSGKIKVYYSNGIHVLVVFFLWFLSFGMVLDYFDRIQKEEENKFLQRFQEALQNKNIEELKSFFPKGKEKEFIHKIQPLWKEGTLKIGGCQEVLKYMKDDKKDRAAWPIYKISILSPQKANLIVFLENKKPLNEKGKWEIQDFKLEIKAGGEEGNPLMPQRLVECRWDDFIFQGSQTIFWENRQRMIRFFRHKLTGIEFTEVPGGSFNMGSPKKVNTRPIQKIHLKDFLISKREITQGEWVRAMKSQPWLGKKGVQRGENYPACFVSWYDARKFCRKYGFSLPSEAQWEYAYRAGSLKDFYIDSLKSQNFLWYSVTVGQEKWPHEVGQRIPNALDLYDMAGNLWEWCQDDWSFDLSHKSKDGSPYVTYSHRAVVRGGCWNSLQLEECSAWFRSARYKDNRSNEVGFRVVAIPK